jgi:hypothetical protein
MIQAREDSILAFTLFTDTNLAAGQPTAFYVVLYLHSRIRRLI